MSESIAILQKERDEARAACAEMRQIVAAAHYLIIEHHSSQIMREELFECPKCTKGKGEAILIALARIAFGKDDHGKGWLSPEKRKQACEMVEEIAHGNPCHCFKPVELCNCAEELAKKAYKLLETE